MAKPKTRKRASPAPANKPKATARKAPAASGPLHLNIKLSRAKLEQMIEDLIQRTLEPMKKALSDAGLKPSEIDEVLLVGGSTRIPKIQTVVKEFFGKEPNKGVNPDEVVAIGAAVQGAVLTGEQKDVLLLDVTPLSLGIETLGGVMTVLIPRNTTIPTEATKVFSTAHDNQGEVRVEVYQGESRMASDNELLGQFVLDHLRQAPRGQVKVRIGFEIDSDGIVHVVAEDLDRGAHRDMRIEASSGLTQDEVQSKRFDELDF